LRCSVAEWQLFLGEILGNRNGVVKYIRPVDESTQVLSQSLVENCELFDNANRNCEIFAMPFANGPRELAVLDQASRILADAKSLDEIKTVRDKAEAARFR
jgi:hypothetical protein